MFFFEEEKFSFGDIFYKIYIFPEVYIGTGTILVIKALLTRNWWVDIIPFAFIWFTHFFGFRHEGLFDSYIEGDDKNVNVSHMAPNNELLKSECKFKKDKLPLTDIHKVKDSTSHWMIIRLLFSKMVYNNYEKCAAELIKKKRDYLLEKQDEIPKVTINSSNFGISNR